MCSRLLDTMKTISAAKGKARYDALPADMRAAIDRIMQGRIAHSEQAKRLLLNDAIDTVIRAIECDQPCCALLTKEERLSEKHLLEGT